MPTRARKSGRTHQPSGGNVQTRCVGYWPGDGTNPARVLYTVDTNMFALNAATGNTDPGFGKEGVVDIEITWGGAPYVYKNLIIMGNNNGERSDGPAGDTKVYDARTGAELWRFKTMVQPGDKNYPGAWLDHSDEHPRAGLNVWGWYFTVDEQRDLLYMPVGGRRAIIMEAIVPATICTEIQSSLSTPPRANTCGTSNSFTTTFGTTMYRPHPACLT